MRITCDQCSKAFSKFVLKPQENPYSTDKLVVLEDGQSVCHTCIQKLLKLKANLLGSSYYSQSV